MADNSNCSKYVGCTQAAHKFCPTAQEIAEAQADIEAGNSPFANIDEWFIAMQDLQPKFELGNTDPFTITRNVSTDGVPNTKTVDGGFCCSTFSNEGSTMQMTLTCITKDALALAQGAVPEVIDTSLPVCQYADPTTNPSVFIHGIPDPDTVSVIDALTGAVITDWSIKGAIMTVNYTSIVKITYQNLEGCCFDGDTNLGGEYFMEFAGYNKSDKSLCSYIFPCVRILPSGDLDIVTASGDTAADFEFEMTPSTDHHYLFDGPWKKFASSQGGLNSTFNGLRKSKAIQQKTYNDSVNILKGLFKDDPKRIKAIDNRLSAPKWIVQAAASKEAALAVSSKIANAK